MKELSDRLAIYEKLLWPKSHQVNFSYDDGKGKTLKVSGLVTDVFRNIHENKIELVIGESRHGFNMPEKVYWDEEASELTLEYGSEVIAGDFFADVEKAEWGESMSDTMKRTAPKNHKTIVIKVS